jgi:hypothetical protein
MAPGDVENIRRLFEDWNRSGDVDLSLFDPERSRVR